jgi:hypothetical protein
MRYAMIAHEAAKIPVEVQPSRLRISATSLGDSPDWYRLMTPKGPPSTVQ